MDSTDLKVFLAKVYREVPDENTEEIALVFDNFYIHTTVYLYESSYKIQSLVLIPQNEENPHTVIVNVFKDSSTVNIKEIETAMTGTISLAPLGFGPTSEFSLRVVVKEEGQEKIKKPVSHADAKQYVRPLNSND